MKHVQITVSIACSVPSDDLERIVGSPNGSWLDLIHFLQSGEKAATGGSLNPAWWDKVTVSHLESAEGDSSVSLVVDPSALLSHLDRWLDGETHE